MSTLRDEVHANPACAVALAARDCNELARIMSIGRMRPSAIGIGSGTILDTIGMAQGNILLDYIYGQPTFRYVKPLLEQGRLLVGSPIVQTTLQSLATGGVITQADADALCALGLEPDPYTAQAIAVAVFNDDGSLK